MTGEAARREETAVVRHGRRVHVERHEPRGAGIAPEAAVGVCHGAEVAGVVIVVAIVHADAAGVHHGVHICAVGVLIAAGVG